MKMYIFVIARTHVLKTLQFTYKILHNIGVVYLNFKVFFAVGSGESREATPSLLFNLEQICV